MQLYAMARIKTFKWQARLSCTDEAHDAMCSLLYYHYQGTQDLNIESLKAIPSSLAIQ